MIPVAKRTISTVITATPGEGARMTVDTPNPTGNSYQIGKLRITARMFT
jgi:hypothetical protein